MASRERDEELLRALHDAHGPALWSYVTLLLHGDRTRAQDVVQETLLRAWRNPEVLATNASARGWLYTVAKRIVIDEWRAASRRPETLTGDVPERAATDDLTEHALNRQIVLAALKTLSPEHRAVLVECYFRGRSVAEAAHALGVPPGTVKSRTHYALHALRAALTEMGGAS